MTVCIAAICSYGPWDSPRYLVVGASDRMLSGADIHFEPPQSKIYGFGPFPGVSVIALVAGDPYAQIAICDATADFIRSAKMPPTTVEAVAVIYAERFSAHRRRVAETAILKPHGMDANSLIDRQQDFRREVVADLMHRMEQYKLDVETIITGVDAKGAHIFVVTDPGQIDCADSVGFAAIGTGKPHADSQFMMARHTRAVPWPRALLSTYIAKKRAEITPTVGRLNTDLFFVGDPGLGYQPVSSEIQDRVADIYYEMEARVFQETERAGADAHKIINEIINRPPPQPPQQSSEASNPPQRPEPALSELSSPPSGAESAVIIAKPKKKRAKRAKAPPPSTSS